MTIDEAMNPTIDDAIKRLEGMVFTSDFSPQTLRAVAVNKLALAALREKAERDKGCDYCNDPDGDNCYNSIYIDRTNRPAITTHDVYVPITYCPMCGRRLEAKHE